MKWKEVDFVPVRHMPEIHTLHIKYSSVNHCQLNKACGISTTKSSKHYWIEFHYSLYPGTKITSILYKAQGDLKSCVSLHYILQPIATKSMQRSLQIHRETNKGQQKVQRMD